VADGDAVLRWAETTANLDVLAACPPHLPPPDTGPDLALDPQCRGRSQLRLHAGELPSPRPPIPPEPATRLLPQTGQGASFRTQDRSPPRPCHRPAQTEPLHLRHQSQPGPPRTPSQPGRRRTDPQGRRIRAVAAPDRRRAPTRLAADHGRCRRRSTT